jgi:hypothetical protein
MTRQSTIFGSILLTAAATFSTSAFSMVQRQVSCQGIDGDKKFFLESLIEEDESSTRLLWTTGAIEARSPFESGSINMLQDEVRQFSFDGSRLSLSMANVWTPAEIKLTYDFGNHAGQGSVVVPTQNYGVEVKGAGSVRCLMSEVKQVTSDLPKLPMSGLYGYLLPSKQRTYLNLEVSESQIVLSILGSPAKIIFTSKDRLVWTSNDRHCALSLYATPGTGNTSDSFYLDEERPCVTLDDYLAGPYRLSN